MTARTANTDKMGMTSFEVNHADDFRAVDDCVFEEHDVHLLHFGLGVIACKAVVQLSSHFVDVCNLFVNCRLRIALSEEVDEYSVIIASLAVFFVVHLPNIA